MSLDVALAVLGFTILLVGALSVPLKRIGLSVPLLALLLGVVLGPEVLSVLEPERAGDDHKLLEELARLTLAFSLVATGLQFSPRDLRENLSRGGLLLTVAMAGMWAMTSLGAYLLLDVPWEIAPLIGAILTPTDPVVASSIVTGRLAEANLPRWLRRTLQLESGANDGLALVFVLVPALLLAEPDHGLGGAVAEGAWKVAVSVALGAVIGGGAGLLLERSKRHQEISEAFFFALAFGVALAVIGFVHWVGGTGVLGAFVAGLAFSLTVSEDHRDELESVQSGVERTLLSAVFLLFGAMLPWDGWLALGWPALAFVAWVLLLRRPPVVPLALAAARTPARPVAFIAWFGPLGVAAIYYSLFVERYGFEEQERIFAAATMAIAASIAVHTVTAMPGVRRYAGRRVRTTLLHPFRPDVDAQP